MNLAKEGFVLVVGDGETVVDWLVSECPAVYDVFLDDNNRVK